MKMCGQLKKPKYQQEQQQKAMKKNVDDQSHDVPVVDLALMK